MQQSPATLCNGIDWREEMTRLVTTKGLEIVGFVHDQRDRFNPMAVVRNGNTLRALPIESLELVEEQDIVEEAVQALEEREAAWSMDGLRELQERLRQEVQPGSFRLPSPTVSWRLINDIINFGR